MKKPSAAPIKRCSPRTTRRLTSAAGRGVPTTARLSHRKTPSSPTSHRFVRAGDLVNEPVVEGSSPGPNARGESEFYRLAWDGRATTDVSR
jgi:hypothetical protein